MTDRYRGLIDKVPLDYLKKAYAGLHDLDLELAVEKVGDVSFSSMEQYLMYEKAVVFEDINIAEKFWRQRMQEHMLTSDYREAAAFDADERRWIR